MVDAKQKWHAMKANATPRSGNHTIRFGAAPLRTFSPEVRQQFTTTLTLQFRAPIVSSTLVTLFYFFSVAEDSALS